MWRILIAGAVLVAVVVTTTIVSAAAPVRAEPRAACRQPDGRSTAGRVRHDARARESRLRPGDPENAPSAGQRDAERADRAPLGLRAVPIALRQGVTDAAC